MKILVVVDYQHDFVFGKLAVPNALSIKDKIQNEIDYGDYDKYIYTLDTHEKQAYEKSEEKKLFPEIHCERGTIGWNLEINPRTSIYKKQNFKIFSYEKEIFVCKDKFDVFAGNKEYEKMLEIFGKNIEFTVVGVATNYCVFFHVMGLLQRGYKVILKKDFIKGIPDGTESIRINEMIKNGVIYK